MARQPMVTRTITTTHATVLCLDTENREPCNKDIVLPRTYKDEASMLKVAKTIAETDTLKLVQIVAHHTEETLYGMSESEFISVAKPMPSKVKENEAE